MLHQPCKTRLFARVLPRGSAIGVAIFIVAGCAASNSDNSPDNGSSGGSGGEADAETQFDAPLSSDVTGPLLDAHPGGDGSTAGSCSKASTLIYVLGKTHELYSFDPATLQLGKVGMLNCPQNGGSATPFSMAVDRKGIAWVLYNDGHLYHVDTATAACTATSFTPGQSGFTKFGMGFVSDTPGSEAEKLYVANEDRIGVIDTGTFALTPAGGTFGFSAMVELTGTGDARLFGLFYGFPPYISEINKANSQLLGEMPLDTVDIGTGFAYAFWGGDFWVFTAPNGVTSQIDRYQPSAGTTTTTVVVQDVGFKIVGAGVSTCAPVQAPK